MAHRTAMAIIALMTGLNLAIASACAQDLSRYPD